MSVSKIFPETNSNLISLHPSSCNVMESKTGNQSKYLSEDGNSILRIIAPFAWHHVTVVNRMPIEKWREIGKTKTGIK